MSVPSAKGNRIPAPPSALARQFPRGTRVLARGDDCDGLPGTVLGIRKRRVAVRWPLDPAYVGLHTGRSLIAIAKPAEAVAALKPKP